MLSSEYQSFISQPAAPGKFIPDGSSINQWADVATYFSSLSDRNPVGKDELWQWLQDRSELNSWLEEDLAWRYIRMTCDTSDEKAVSGYTYFIETIEPEVSLWQNKLDEKLAAHPDFEQLDFNGAPVFYQKCKERPRAIQGRKIYRCKPKCKPKRRYIRPRSGL